MVLIQRCLITVSGLQTTAASCWGGMAVGSAPLCSWRQCDGLAAMACKSLVQTLVTWGVMDFKRVLHVGIRFGTKSYA